ncbi:mandelate racemase/muconate lactonizing enzyme family protein [Actinopolymorpha alba]|uniref:mandelate racemase/muconate lactonizing enzyme family protein n=1 Tax=Actinopolymorpha alba TaxID=533267 RepID=UPI00036C8D16|nr:enolase C-terminal domain-like protein [Actinopolymorpha alba]
MRVSEIDVWVVNVPLTTTFASSFEAKAGTTRTVVRVRTDDGLEGWGETMNGRPTAALITRIKEQFIGLDPRATAEVARRCAMVPFFYGYIGYCALAALEMAFLDLSCRAWQVPLHLYLGGAARHTIPITALLTRGAAGNASKSDLPAVLADKAKEEISALGFTALKFKGSVDARFDVSVMGALREALPDLALRVDPNAAWSVPASIAAGRALDPLGLEYLEDPCEGLEGMARVRSEIATPLCTNMCVVRLEDLAPAIRMNAVDIVHADVHKWGGVRPTMDLDATCRIFGLGLNFHSGGELGISTACHLHVAAALARLEYAIDAMYYLTAEDILTERIAFSDGALAVPQGPGLGVTVDLDRLTFYARRNAEDGDHTP